MAHAGHQFLEARSGGGGQSVADVAKVEEVKVGEADRRTGPVRDAGSSSPHGKVSRISGDRQTRLDDLWVPVHCGHHRTMSHEVGRLPEGWTLARVAEVAGAEFAESSPLDTPVFLDGS